MNSNLEAALLHFHILGVFPKALEGYFNTGLIGKAFDRGQMRLHYHSLRDYAIGSYKAIDDKAYGPEPGMVLTAPVVTAAVRALKKEHKIEHVVFTSPSGPLFNAAKAKELSQKKSVLILCGRYEGVDQRALDLVVDEEISIGDYVLTGGELPAAVIIEATSRFVAGVIGKSESVLNDSFESGLVRHPVYTRPEVFENQAVPSVLLSGHHEKILEYQRKASLYKTFKTRPMLLKQARLTSEELAQIKEWLHS